jgi:lysophospholipase L1-like esterase
LLRRVAINIALTVASLALCLPLAEAIVRLAGLGPVRLVPAGRIANTKGTEVRAGTVALLCFPTNPRGYFPIDLRDAATYAHYADIGMRRLPEARVATPYAVESRYNSRIFRGPEFPPRRPGVRRVVLIGDSFTEGWGVKEEDTAAAALERLLNAGAPGAWDVLNCARANSDFPGLWFLFRHALTLDPDVVVLLMNLNDPIRSADMDSRLNRQYNLIVVRGGPLLTEAPLRKVMGVESQLATRLADIRETRRLDLEMTRWYRDLYGWPNRHGWHDTKKLIEKMNETMSERGGSFLLGLWPLMTGLEGDYPFEEAHATVADFARKRAIAFHDLLPAFRGRRSSALWVHVLDHHPNEIGQRLAAESLAPAVKAARPAAPPSATADGT